MLSDRAGVQQSRGKTPAIDNASTPRGNPCLVFGGLPGAISATKVLLEGVGVEGVEPPTSSASCMRSNQLSYTPEQRTTLPGRRRRPPVVGVALSGPPRLPNGGPTTPALPRRLLVSSDDSTREPSPARGTPWRSPARLAAMLKRPLRTTSQRWTSSNELLTRPRSTSPRSGWLRRRAMSRRYQSSSELCGSRSSSDQSSLDRRNVAGDWGSGHLGPPADGVFRPASFADRSSQLRVLVVGEIEERRGGAPLLALEQHRHKRRKQDQSGAHPQ